MIHFVGAGPGSPDLITVRGKQYLEEADVIIYAGSLVNKTILQKVLLFFYTWILENRSTFSVLQYELYICDSLAALCVLKEIKPSISKQLMT